MKVIQMSINNKLERIDNNEVKRCCNGYHMEKKVGLWNNKTKTTYLTDEEISDYIKILNHNKKVDSKSTKIKSAIKNGRVEKVNQFINNNSLNGSGVIFNIYYDELGNII